MSGEYITWVTTEKERARKYQHVSFTSSSELSTATKKKQLVALIEGIPQSAVTRDSAFVVTEKNTASILFDITKVDSYLKALEGQDHIVEFYIVTPKKGVFEDIKARISELLGPVVTTEEMRRPMSEGFSSNLEYFRLDFLEKDHVALGRQFREILPILWLRAGATGPRPEIPKNKPIPAMVIPDSNRFAVLVDELQFAAFRTKIGARTDLTHIYLVTDSEEAFQEMAAQCNAPNVIQLYRDYLENFVINKGGTTQ